MSDEEDLGSFSGSSGEDNMHFVAPRVGSKMPASAFKQPRKQPASKRPLSALKGVPAKRPKPQGTYDQEDSEEEDYDEEEDDLAEARQLIDAEAEEDDEDEEEDEEPSYAKKPSKRLTGASFIDDAAEEVDDEDDGNADEELDNAAAERLFQEYDNRPRRQYISNLRNEQEDEDEDLRRQADLLEERYRGVDIEREADYEYVEPSALEKNLLPSIRDPKLWLVKCKPGKERFVVMSLLNLYYKKMSSGDDPLFIKSAFTTDSSPGYFYVEADKEIHVKKAVEGLQFVFSYKVAIVPIKEMVQALEVKPVSIDIKVGQWVKMKRGIYKDDIAQVVMVQDQNTLVTVRLIPRLEISKSAVSSKRRPPQRLFNPAELRELGEEIERRTEPSTSLKCYFHKNNFYRRGFLYKSLKVDSLDTANVAPTVTEMEVFQSRPAAVDSDDEDDDLDNQVATESNSSAPAENAVTFCRGDSVIVVDGDLMQLTGVVLSTSGDKVKIKPNHEDLTEPIEFSSSSLRKHFKLGDHVKISNGEYSGETGLIVNITQDKESVIVFSDITNREMKVPINFIVESTEVAAGKESLGNFELYDFVSFGDSVGVIIRVEAGHFQVIDNKGIVHRVRLQDVQHRKTSRFAVALDSREKQITKDDIVRVISGSHAGKQGTIQHIFRSFIFLLSREVLENGGIFVVRAKECQIVGQSLSSQKSGPVVGGAGPGGFRGPRGAAGMSTVGSRGGSFAAAKHGFVKDSGIGETVTIRAGPYKSLMGIIKDASDTHFRIELHSRAKVVSVLREHVSRRGSESQHASLDTGYGPGAQTPLIGSRTPGYQDHESSRTPHYGSRTPMPYGGGSGSAWVASTPAPDNWSRTPVSSSSSGMVPNYDPGHQAFTPGGPRTSSHMSYAPTTPSYDLPPDTYGTSRYPQTPGAGSSYPQTPGGVSSYPQTPGGLPSYTSHLPGTAYAPQTPGSSAYAPQTPGGAAYAPQTPGGAAYAPQTPGGAAYAPQTPGGAAYAPQTPGGAAYAPQTPGGLPYAPQTPGGYPQTPGGALGYPRTPGGYPATPGAPTTPGGRNLEYDPYGGPVTPGGPITPSPYTPMSPSGSGVPATPGSLDSYDYDSSAALASYEWVRPGVCVTSRSQQDGVIVSASNDMVSVKIGDSVSFLILSFSYYSQVSTFGVNELRPVVPAKGDEIIVLSGETIGSLGTLIGLDGGDGIVRTAQQDIAILDMNVLAKYHTPR
jgi:transcription elongation factor SPT5